MLKNDQTIPSNENEARSSQSDTKGSSVIMELSHNVNDYEVVEDIGRGQFGVVQKIKLKNDPKIRYNQMHEREKKQLAQEVQLLQTLSHPHVVRYIGKINEKSKALLYLIMEYCDGGDLGRYLEHTVKKGHFLSEEVILVWFRQLVDALHYCHTRPAGRVLHRDLKPQNILLSGKFKKLKLADFGLAKMMQPTQLMAQTHVGTPYYMSPEILARRQYDEKSDIWSLGCLIFEMSSGLSPFSRATSYDDLCRLVQLGKLDDSQIPNIYAPEIFSIIKWMLSNEPEDRPTTDALKETTLYKWATALRYRDLSEYFKEIIETQKVTISQRNGEIRQLTSKLEIIIHDLKFIEEFIQFQNESDEAIQRSLRLIGSALSKSRSFNLLNNSENKLKEKENFNPIDEK